MASLCHFTIVKPEFDYFAILETSLLDPIRVHHSSSCERTCASSGLQNSNCLSFIHYFLHLFNLLLQLFKMGLAECEKG